MLTCKSLSTFYHIGSLGSNGGHQWWSWKFLIAWTWYHQWCCSLYCDHWMTCILTWSTKKSAQRKKLARLIHYILSLHGLNTCKARYIVLISRRRQSYSHEKTHTMYRVWEHGHQGYCISPLFVRYGDVECLWGFTENGTCTRIWWLPRFRPPRI
jgi:hypothetical protein